MEERTLRRADDAALPEAVDRLLLPVLRIHQEADLGGGTLGENFAELPQLDQRHDRIAREVRLCLRAQGDQARVVVREKREVGRRLGVHERLAGALSGPGSLFIRWRAGGGGPLGNQSAHLETKYKKDTPFSSKPSGPQFPL
ncbi:MAG TPA: hypothetical protein VGY54_13500 [Polyangiaceae bacterium]|nr:hypothetical protein [Polyangiaceae bacterium]